MGKHRKYTPEFKIGIVKKVIEEHIGINEIARQNDMDDHVVRNWLKNYQEYSESYFYEEHRGNHKGNPYAALHRSKSLSKEERLELENLKLRIENERLKKGYMVKGVGANKEFVFGKEQSMKLSKN